MRRTIILSAVGTIALTIGLGVSATLASGATYSSNPATSIPMMGSANDNMMKGTGMDDMMGTDAMTSMMNGSGTGNMMGADGMDAMHSAMHDALSGGVPADVLAACDTAHASMSSTTSPRNSLDAAHTAHHPGTQS